MAEFFYIDTFILEKNVEIGNTRFWTFSKKRENSRNILEVGYVQKT